MKVLMYAVGGIGGFLGSYLTKLDIDITFIARGDRFGHLLSKGLIRIESTNGKFVDIALAHIKNISFLSA